MSNSYSTLIVQGALWALLFFSVVTWALILIKAVQVWRVSHYNRRFDKAFWAAHDFNAAAAITGVNSPQGRVAASAFAALTDPIGPASHDLQHSWDRLELLERHLRQQIQKERRAVENGLAVLASIGSTAPFVGLFGTVFGIIHALSAISHAASASIDVVAGPIGEALIATGIGIAVAVPAVLAYNFFVRRLKVLGASLDDFATDFINLAQKNQYRVNNTSGSGSGAQGTRKDVSHDRTDGAYA